MPDLISLHQIPSNFHISQVVDLSNNHPFSQYQNVIYKCNQQICSLEFILPFPQAHANLNSHTKSQYSNYERVQHGIEKILEDIDFLKYLKLDQNNQRHQGGLEQQDWHNYNYIQISEGTDVYPAQCIIYKDSTPVRLSESDDISSSYRLGVVPCKDVSASERFMKAVAGNHIKFEDGDYFGLPRQPVREHILSRPQREKRAFLKNEMDQTNPETDSLEPNLQSKEKSPEIELRQPGRDSKIQDTKGLVLRRKGEMDLKLQKRWTYWYMYCPTLRVQFDIGDDSSQYSTLYKKRLRCLRCICHDGIIYPDPSGNFVPARPQVLRCNSMERVNECIGVFGCRCVSVYGGSEEGDAPWIKYPGVKVPQWAIVGEIGSRNRYGSTYTNVKDFPPTFFDSPPGPIDNPMPLPDDKYAPRPPKPPVFVEPFPRNPILEGTLAMAAINLLAYNARHKGKIKVAGSHLNGHKGGDLIKAKNEVKATAQLSDMAKIKKVPKTIDSLEKNTHLMDTTDLSVEEINGNTSTHIKSTISQTSIPSTLSTRTKAKPTKTSENIKN